MEAAPTNVLLPGHDVPLGRYTTVRRLLPHLRRRMVGAWCFVDHFGPDEVSDGGGMRIGPHPHTGLQTVSWLVEGEILHRDSLGSRQLVSPGQVNLMTAGHGIAHSEESPREARGTAMHGLQLWVAMPDGARHGGPRFEHHPSVPVLDLGTAELTLVVGAFGGQVSPAVVHTPLLGAEIRLAAGARAEVPLDPAFEHAMLMLDGGAEVAGEPLKRGTLLYLDRGRRAVTLDGAVMADGGGGARLFLLGGEPFDEPLVMWWNFVGRTHEEIVSARTDWMAERRFGAVVGYPGDRLPAPELPTVRLKARDRHGLSR
jgi:redox-sensitive bicupin YhaK (pirin superfamily)